MARINRPLTTEESARIEQARKDCEAEHDEIVEQGREEKIRQGCDRLLEELSRDEEEERRAAQDN